MKKIIVLIISILITAGAFAALVFTNINTEKTDPGAPIWYYHVAPGNTHLEPFDPYVDYGCDYGPYACIISSNVPLSGFSIPSDALISVVATRSSP